MHRMNSKHYDSDLTDTEFAILEPLLPARKAKGRPRSVALRRSSTPSSTSCAAACRGGCCRTASRAERRPSTTSGSGA